MILSLVVAAWCASSAAQSIQQPPRDSRPGTAATSTISGTVASDDAQHRKLRRVRVTINGASMETGGRTVITDDEGRYQFEGLSPGQYGLTAVKDGYIAARYGSGRPPRLGNIFTVPTTGLTLRPGDSVIADFRLAHGAVITGVVTDTEGRPEEGALVAALSYQFISGAPGRRLVAASSPLRTDDRGVYRIYGLRAGEYVISAQHATLGAQGPLKLSSTDARSVVAAPVFFPSATDVTTATWIKVSAGDERSGVDIQMRYVPIATVSGVAAMPPGASFGRVSMTRATSVPASVEIVASTSIQPTGAFTLPGAPPGHYTLYAIAQSPPGPSGSPNGSWSTGSMDVDLDGEDITNIAIPLSSTLSLSGTLLFDGASPPSIRLGSMTLPIAPFAGGYGVPTPYFRPIDATHFTISGVIPGAYRLVGTNVLGIRTPLGTWWLKSIVISGKEALDGPVDIRQPVDDIIVTVSDQASTVSGTARDAQGSALPGAYVVIFAADRAGWFFNSRRIASVRTDAQGRYTIRNLPPGDYRAALTLDLEQGEWFDPDVLETLLPSAVVTAISGTETKTLDLILR